MKRKQIFIFDRGEVLVAVLGLPEGCQYFDAWHLEEINGENSFEFTVMADHEDSDYIQPAGYAGFYDIDGDFQLFEIVEVEENHGELLTKRVFCQHASIELDDEIVTDIRPTNATAESALRSILAGTRWEVGEVDDLGRASTTFYYQSVWSAIHKILEVWGGELRCRTLAVADGVSHRYIDILERRGKKRGKRFERGKDIEKLIREAYSGEIKTALYGRGKGEEVGEGHGRRITFEDVEWGFGDPADKPLGQEWVGDEEAREKFGRIGEDGERRHRYGVFVDDEIEDPEELLEKTWEELQKKKEIETLFDTGIIDSEEVHGLDHEKVRLGDENLVVSSEFRPPLIVESRVVSLKRYLNEPERTEIKLGDYTQRFFRFI